MADTAHGTLEVDTVTPVTVTSGSEGVVVVNRNQAGVIWVRLDGVDPVPEGTGCYAVLGAREFPQGRHRQAADVEVRMLAATAIDYSVEAY